MPHPDNVDLRCLYEILQTQSGKVEAEKMNKLESFLMSRKALRENFFTVSFTEAISVTCRNNVHGVHILTVVSVRHHGKNVEYHLDKRACLLHPWQKQATKGDENAYRF